LPADRDEATDAELARRAAAGEAAAFDALAARWSGRVYRLARRFFRRAEDAEEVVQETLLKAWRALGSYRAEAPFEHWLLRIATRTCYDALRERRRRRETLMAEITEDAGRWLDAALKGASLETAHAEEARRVAASLLETRPPKDRVVLVLLDLEGMPAADVAAATGSTRAAVKVRAMRARRALRRLVKDLGRRS
jgi:RNA polymerase sigma-70 factor (ECF subfamily)